MPKFDEYDSQRFKKNNRYSSNSGFNVLTGAAHEFVSNRSNYRRQSLLPPAKCPPFNGNKAEYSDGLAASPRVFYRQNGDFTNFSGMKVANSMISSKNFSQKMSSSLFH